MGVAMTMAMMMRDQGVEQVRAFQMRDETSSVLLGEYSLQLKHLRSFHLHMRSLRIIIFEELMC